MRVENFLVIHRHANITPLLSILISALAFLVLISVLVLIHECGHFFAARQAGVVVEEFGFGLPPRAKKLFVWQKTKFSLNWIPFGGFVRLKGENAETEKERHARGSFMAAPISSRVVILVAGVAMNFLFAFIIFTFGFSLGHWIPTYLSYADLESAAKVGEVHMIPGIIIDKALPGQGAAAVNLPTPSMLLKVDGKAVTSPEDVAPLQAGKSAVTYTVLSGKDLKTEVSVQIPLVDGRTGVELQAYPRDLSAPLRSPLTGSVLALREGWVLTVQTVWGLGQLAQSLFTSGRVPEGITGIIGIAEYTHRSVQLGFMTYLRLLATLSLSIAILNILPIPALDGGRLFFVLLEAVRRKPADQRLEMTTNLIGFVVILLLITIVTYHDILRLF